MAPQSEAKLKRKNFTGIKEKTGKKSSQTKDNYQIPIELKEEILSKLSAILSSVQEIVSLL